MVVSSLQKHGQIMQILTLPLRLTLLLIVLLALIGCSLIRSPEQQWRVDLQTYNTRALTEHYFGYFLAIQSPATYDLTDPELHSRIDEWINDNEPIDCEQPPSSTGSKDSVSVHCECILDVDGLHVEFSDVKQFYVVKEFESIEVSLCIED